VGYVLPRLRRLLANVFAFYLKTKNFHRHMTDEIAESARKTGGTTVRSVGDIAPHQRLKDNGKESFMPGDMMAEIYLDNRELTEYLLLLHETCEKHNDIATASLIESWVDQAERRSWFLGEITKEV
jgi:starvation-inducible DNA-binding protein